MIQVVKGKSLIFLDKENVTNISQDIDILRMKKINPYYVTVFLKSIYGNKQIWMRSRGVGAPKIPFDEIKSIKIAILPESIQKNVEIEYKKMDNYHKKAMQTKKLGNEVECKKYLEKARIILKDLITHTEAVIRGERDDII
jgi:restriction endonuclease S subunit